MVELAAVELAVVAAAVGLVASVETPHAANAPAEPSRRADRRESAAASMHFTLTSAPVSVLIVSATSEEAAYVPTHLELLVTGVGKVFAATAVARRLARGDVSEVVNIGSAGALRDDLAGVFEIGRVLNHDLSAEALRGFGYDPQEWLALGPAETALATGDLFVSDPTVRAALAEQAHLVDMEGYAVAWAARHAGVPVRLVKHVSDNASSDALDWPTLVDRSARDLGDWLRAAFPA